MVLRTSSTTQKEEMITKRWATMKEACAYLSVSPSTIERWVASGHLTKHKVEGYRSVRFSVDELDALLTPVSNEDEDLT